MELYFAENVSATIIPERQLEWLPLFDRWDLYVTPAQDGYEREAIQCRTCGSISPDVDLLFAEQHSCGWMISHPANHLHGGKEEAEHPASVELEHLLPNTVILSVIHLTDTMTKMPLYSLT